MILAYVLQLAIRSRLVHCVAPRRRTHQVDKQSVPLHLLWGGCQITVILVGVSAAFFVFGLTIKEKTFRNLAEQCYGIVTTITRNAGISASKLFVAWTNVYLDKYESEFGPTKVISECLWQASCPNVFSGHRFRDVPCDWNAQKSLIVCLLICLLAGVSAGISSGA